MRLRNYFALQTIVLSDVNYRNEIRSLAAKYCNTEQNQRPLKKVEGFTGQTANAMLLIIDGGNHPEGIEAFTKEVATVCEKSEVFRGVELLGESSQMSQYETGITIVVLSAGGIDEFEQCSRVPDMNGVVRCIISPVEYEARVICRADSVGVLCKELDGEWVPSPTAPIVFKYAWTEYQRPEHDEGGRRGRYDVIWAQLNEALINTAVSLRERIARLEVYVGTEVPRSRAIIDLRLPLATFRENLEMLIAGARTYQERVPESKLSMAGPLDMISNYVLRVERQVSVLEKFLEQRGTGVESEEWGGSRADGAIMALDGVAHFCGRIIEHTHGTSSTERRQWAVLLGQQVRLIDAPEFRGMLPIDTSWTAPGASFRISGRRSNRQGAHIGIIEFPRRWRLRSGSFPLIAWAVSHDYGSGGWADDAIDELQVEVERESTMLRKDTGASSALTIVNTTDLARDVFHDLISISMLGPAYVYSLARFGLLGRIGGLDWTGLAKYAGAISEDLVRLRLDLRILKSLGLEVPFFTDAFSPARKEVSGRKLKDILDRQGPIVQKRYEFSVREVMPSLIRGEVEGWAPDLTLNALWRGVAERGKHVNEAAVLWSLMRWGANRPEVDLADC